MRTAVLAGPATTTSGLPRPRGELSAAVVAALSGDLGWDRVPLVEPSSDEDALLTAWIAHELHHRGLPEFQDAEWTPELIAVRMRIERDLEARLRERAVGRLPESADADVLLDYVR